jgi:hypothetical protein
VTCCHPRRVWRRAARLRHLLRPWAEGRLRWLSWRRARGPCATRRTRAARRSSSAWRSGCASHTARRRCLLIRVLMAMKVSSIRHLAYASDVGEAFRPTVPKWMVNGTYAVAVGRVAEAHAGESRAGTLTQRLAAATSPLTWRTRQPRRTERALRQRRRVRRDAARNGERGRQWLSASFPPRRCSAWLRRRPRFSCWPASWRPLPLFTPAWAWRRKRSQQRLLCSRATARQPSASPASRCCRWWTTPSSTVRACGAARTRLRRLRQRHDCSQRWRRRLIARGRALAALRRRTRSTRDAAAPPWVN